jgi:hypothetical protein
MQRYIVHRLLQESCCCSAWRSSLALALTEIHRPDAAGRRHTEDRASQPHAWADRPYYEQLYRFLPSARMGDRAYILPALTLGTFAVAGLMRLVRSSMLEVLMPSSSNWPASKGCLRLVI